MSRWRKTVNIKDLLSDDSSSEEAERVAGILADRLASQLAAELENDNYLEEIVDELREVAGGAGGRFANPAFNSILSNLYDWADDNRVWLGI